MIDDIIDPVNTRPILIDLLEITAKKEEVRPLRKHGNMPL
jgi:acetyl-CoA carboxylase carboxyltransferase component